MLLSRKDQNYIWQFPQKSNKILNLRDVLFDLPELDPFIREGIEKTLKIFPDFEKKKEYSKRLLQDSRTYDAIVGDIYGMGRVLATNKFKWLKRSYQTFLIGLISAISIFSFMEFVPYIMSLIDFEVIAEKCRNSIE